MKIDWKTPPDLWGALNAEFAFETDVCAQPWNAQCQRYYTPEIDGLAVPWEGRCWCNPPFDPTRALWIKKAWHEAQRGILSVVLVNCNTAWDTNWWHNYAMRSSEVRCIKHRPTFTDKNGKTAAMRVMAIVFRPQCNGPAILKSYLRDGRPNADLSHADTTLKQQENSNGE